MFFLCLVAKCCFHFLLVDPRLVEEHMQSHCWAGLVPEMEMPSEVDTILRATAARNQAGICFQIVFKYKCFNNKSILGSPQIFTNKFAKTVQNMTYQPGWFGQSQHHRMDGPDQEWSPWPKGCEPCWALVRETRCEESHWLLSPIQICLKNLGRF